MEYCIQITGSGTPDEIIAALNATIESIKESITNDTLDGAEFEDAT